MTIEIHRPELEQLIQQRIASGCFLDIEDMLMKALEATPRDALALGGDEENDFTFGKRLIEVCAMVKGLTDDVDFSRDPSLDRTLDIS